MAAVTDAQIREQEKERDDRLRKRIAHDAATYATIFEEVQKRLGHFLLPDPPKRLWTLTPTDLKDMATSIFIGLQRGTWR